MPELPLDHPEPFAATLGVMLYPGRDDNDRRKANAFASQFLAEPIRLYYEAGGRLSKEDLERLIMDAGQPLDDLPKRWRYGLATGNIFNMAFGLWQSRPELASWNNAIRVVERILAGLQETGSRSILWSARSPYIGVAHLWAAWALRKGKFAAQPTVGYDGSADFQSFLCESEILLQWGQNWYPPRKKSKPFLPKETWHVPDDWRPLERRPGWPVTGVIPHYDLPKPLLAGLRPAGRPRRTI